MPSEWDGLLERLAQDAERTLWPNGSENWQADKRIVAVLRAKLLPLLEAGQAMVDWESQYRTINHLGKIPPHPFQQFVAARAAALKGSDAK